MSSRVVFKENMNQVFTFRRSSSRSSANASQSPSSPARPNASPNSKKRSSIRDIRNFIREQLVEQHKVAFQYVAAEINEEVKQQMQKIKVATQEAVEKRKEEMRIKTLPPNRVKEIQVEVQKKFLKKFKQETSFQFLGVALRAYVTGLYSILDHEALRPYFSTTWRQMHIAESIKDLTSSGATSPSKKSNYVSNTLQNAARTSLQDIKMTILDFFHRTLFHVASTTIEEAIVEHIKLTEEKHDKNIRMYIKQYI